MYTALRARMAAADDVSKGGRSGQERAYGGVIKDHKRRLYTLGKQPEERCASHKETVMVCLYYDCHTDFNMASYKT